jgi:hypothetical protein
MGVSSWKTDGLAWRRFAPAVLSTYGYIVTRIVSMPDLASRSRICRSRADRVQGAPADE